MTNIDDELYSYSNDFQTIYSILTGMGELHMEYVKEG
jgi:translation elongation factor EF-G